MTSISPATLPNLSLSNDVSSRYAAHAFERRVTLFDPRNEISPWLIDDVATPSNLATLRFKELAMSPQRWAVNGRRHGFT
jgi:hypothetical protein